MQREQSGLVGEGRSLKTVSELVERAGLVSSREFVSYRRGFEPSTEFRYREDTRRPAIFRAEGTPLNLVAQI
jgi:hypothetical protein